MYFKNNIKLIIIFHLICLSLNFLTTPAFAGVGSSMFSLVQSNQDGLEITFQMADSDLAVEKITTGSGETYDRLSITGGGFLGEVGKPELPTVGTFLEIPEGAVAKMEIIASEYHDVDGYFVYPTQPTVPEGETAPFVKDNTAYGIDSFYPVQVAGFHELGYLRSHRTASLIVCPALYNPAPKKLRIYTKIRVRIQYTFASTQTRSSSVAPRSSDSPYFEPIYNNLYINYRQPEIATPTPDPTRSFEDLSFTGADYLIITHDSFYNSESLRRLAADKQQRGLRVLIRTLSDISYSLNITTNPDAKQIVAYLKNAYQTWKIKPSYLLLVGDTNLLPTHYGMWNNYYQSGDSKGWVATDYYYSTMDGNSDIIPDIMIGRLPVRTESILDTIVSKLLNYETNYNPADPWRSKCLLVSSTDDSELRFKRTSDNIKNILTGNGYNCNSLDFSKYDYLKTTEIVNAFNDKIFLINFNSHGKDFGWYCGNGSKIFDEGNSYSINTSDGATALVFSLACSTGMFDQESDQGVSCIGESLLFRSNGAMGFISSSRVSWSPFADSLMWRLNYYINRSAQSLKLGQVLNEAKLSYIGAITKNYEYYYKLHLEMFNLLGDPELTIVQQQRNYPPLSLTAPTSGVSISKGSIYDIEWSWWNTTIAEVNLKLYKTGQKIMDIATVPCTGKYSWKVSLDLPDGDDYYITIEDSVSFLSAVSKNFAVVTPEVINQQLGAGVGLHHFKITDVNNDGFQDLVIPDLVSLALWNKNTGYWDIKRSLATGSNPNNVQVADTDNDGYPDIISNENGLIRVYQWKQDKVDWVAKELPIVNKAFTVGDVNNDGFNDIVSWVRDNIPPIASRLKLNLWDNTLKDWKEWLVQPLDYLPLEISIGDVDNDGYQDIVIVAENGTIVIWLWDQGTGAWKNPIIKPVAQSLYGLMIKDVNNDGLNDIVVGIWQDPGINMLLWDPNLKDWRSKTIPLEAYSQRYTIGDANNDGYNDLIICNKNFKKITVCLWDQQSGDWTNSKTINLDTQPIAVNIGDIDGDGCNDIIIGNANAEKNLSVILWKKQGSAVGEMIFPLKGCIWETGKYATIEWESKNYWPGLIIELWKGDAKFKQLGFRGFRSSYYWNYYKIPDTIPEGSDYRIKVINLEDTSQYCYSYYFTITNPATWIKAFKINQPVADTQLLGGTVCDIDWETLIPGVSKVKIDLWKGAELAKELCTVDNNNNYRWTVPEYLPKGDDYRIKISNVAKHEQSVYTEYFTIVPPSFTVTSPAASVNWSNGCTHKITWQIIGFQECNTVTIELWRWGQRIGAIATVPNTGEYNWKVPMDLKGEGYSIKVYDAYRYNLEVCGYSESFNITEAILGDVNGDGVLTMDDAFLIVKFVSKSNPPNFNEGLADFNKDGKIDIKDALLIGRFLADFLVITNDGNGTTNPSGELGIEGDDGIYITAIPKPGYHFEKWTFTDDSTGKVVFKNAISAKTKVTVSGGDATIRANFAKGILGDVNGDGSVTSEDARLITQYIAGFNLPNFNKNLADINRDGKIDTQDVSLIPVTTTPIGITPF